MADGPNTESTGTPARRFHVWKTAALACSSACLGGIAVVLWHRRELQRMRQEEALPVPEPESADRDPVDVEFV